jgi:hypothetical protein
MGQVVDRAAEDLESDTNLEELRNRQFPSNDGDSIQLPDGRFLGFKEYVHPDDEKRREKLHVVLLYVSIFGNRKTVCMS